jgi:hypothetical protein
MYRISESRNVCGEKVVLANAEFDSCVEWLMMKAREYEPIARLWMHQPELLSILVLRVKTGNGHLFFRLSAE